MGAGYADLLALQGVWLGGRKARTTPALAFVPGDGRREALRDLMERIRRACDEDDAATLLLILADS